MVANNTPSPRRFPKDWDKKPVAPDTTAAEIAQSSDRNLHQPGCEGEMMEFRKGYCWCDGCGLLVYPVPDGTGFMVCIPDSAF